MSIIRSLFGRRSLENPSQPLDPWAGDDAGVAGSLSSSGAVVSRTKVLGLAAVWRAVSLISRTVAKLPLGVYRHVHPGREIDPAHPAHAILCTRPNDCMTPFVLKQVLQHHVLTAGNGYAYIARRQDGRPLELWPLNPDRTYPVRANGVLYYVHELQSGELRRLPAADVLHGKGLGYDGMQGYPVLSIARESLGLGLAAQGYGSVYFRNSARASVVLQHPGKLSKDARANLRESWERMHSGLDNAHRTAILEEGMQAKEMSSNAKDAQLLETRSFSVKEVANWFGIPPHKLGDSGTTSYGSLEQENQSFLDDAVDPWLVMWEEECESKLLTDYQRDRCTHSVCFDRFPLVRADLGQRGAFYTQALTSGWMSRDEVRARENMNPIPGGDGSRYFLPLNLGQAGGDPDGPDGPAVAPGSRLLDVPDRRQLADYDCGPAAVQSVCDYWSVGLADRSAYLDALETTRTAGTRPAAILGLLSRLGLVTTAAAEREPADLARWFSQGQPVLCPIQAGEPGAGSSGHWVTVVGTGLGQVFVLDPAAGLRMFTEEDWLSRWHDTDADGTRYDRYAIAVGEELPVQVEEPEDVTEGDDADGDPPSPKPGKASPKPSPKADPKADPKPAGDAARTQALTQAHRALLADVVGRMVRRIGTHARRAAGKPGTFLAWLDAVTSEHRAVIAEALEPAVLALGLVQGRALRPGDLADSLLAEVRTALLDLSGTCTASTLAPSVDTRLAAWETAPGELQAFRNLFPGDDDDVSSRKA
jgi:HK97 family phage portal protein